MEDFVTEVEARAGFQVRFTERPGHARQLTSDAIGTGYTSVVAAGGDGTLNEVVNGLAANFGAVKLGLLPLGTGNDFARTMEIPSDLSAALDILEQPYSRPCDVAVLDGDADRRYFVNMSAGGASGEVSDRVNTEMKRFWGPLAYLRAAIETLPELEPYQLRLKLDDGSTTEIEALNMIVANGRFVAAGVPIAPEALIDDGLLDILVFRSCTPARLALVTAQVLAGVHLSDGCEEAIFLRSRAVEITADPAMPFNVDGELLEPQQIRFEIIPRAIKIAAPSPRH